MSASEAVRPGPGGPPGGRGPGSSRPSLRNATRVFENRNYRILWLSSAFSFTGMQMQQVARALLAWELTGSFGAVGAVSLSFGLPMMMFSLIGGSMADRFEKRNLTLMTQASTGVLALITAILIATDAISIELLFVIGLVQGTFFAFGMPARTPLMAEVVGPESVMSAIAMSNAAMNATRLFGPALAGVMIGFWDIESAYFVMSGLYVVSSGLLLRVPTGLGNAGQMEGLRRRPQGNMFVEIGRGLRYVASDPRLRLLFAMLFIVTFFAMPYVMLLAGFNEEDLGKGNFEFGMLQSLMGVGALIGSLGIATLTEYDRKPLVQWVAGVGGAAGLIMLAVSAGMFGWWGAAASVVFIGLMFTAYQTLNNTMVMDEAQPEYYGRVMSINMLTFSSMPLMAFPLGGLADRIGAPETFMAQGAIVLAFMAFVALVNGGYTFGRHEPKSTAAPPVAALAGGSGLPEPGGPGGGGAA